LFIGRSLVTNTSNTMFALIVDGSLRNALGMGGSSFLGLRALVGAGVFGSTGFGLATRSSRRRFAASSTAWRWARSVSSAI
jgi:hypothetical protein